MSEIEEPTYGRIADARIIADAVAQYVKNMAYVYTGGSDGCALCKNRTASERVAAGHANCAEEGIAWEATQGLAKEIAGGDLWIHISRALEDPRLFQWVHAAEPTS